MFVQTNQKIKVWIFFWLTLVAYDSFPTSTDILLIAYEAVEFYVPNLGKQHLQAPRNISPPTVL